MDPLRKAEAAEAKAPFSLFAFPQEDKLVVRDLDPGMGLAVARRTVFRKDDNDSWLAVAERVSAGNFSLVGHYKPEVALKHAAEIAFYQYQMKKLIAKGGLLMSGRHLQQGDTLQHTRNMEVFTNCSTSAFSFLLFYLLLNGSGVGRDYSKWSLLVNWAKMPRVIIALSADHADFANAPDGTLTPEEALNLYPKATRYMVPDSREGWAKAVEQVERMAFEERDDETLILDFSEVRPAGSPIMGMQGRPASGPAPLMAALIKVAALKGVDEPLWKQTMMVDHFLAECVLVGGARRSARMATMWWGDEYAVDFALFKHMYRDEHGYPIYYSSNNSLLVDEEFWRQDTFWAREVFEKAVYSSYHDGLGEPGFINVDKLVAKDDGLDAYLDGEYAESEKFMVDPASKTMMGAVIEKILKSPFSMIVNPCGEIPLFKGGGYCVIADGVPFFCDSLEEVLLMFRTTVRALINTNLMNSLYDREVKRTNRIGVGMTGIFEFAWKFFKLGFRDLLDEHGKAKEFWQFLSLCARVIDAEADLYCEMLGVTKPHTSRTMKPAGTTSKLLGLTEGMHLPSMREYIRWVQFRNDDPLVAQYRAMGYPVRELQSYKGMTIVGFPTQPLICKIGMPEDQIVTAAEATAEEQYKWIMLMERYWLRGVQEDGVTPLEEDRSGQLSYTLKYDPKKTSYQDFKAMLLGYQSQIKCCSIMPQADTSVYEYQPEQPVSKDEFIDVLARITDESALDAIDMNSLLNCSTGACGLDFIPEN